MNAEELRKLLEPDTYECPICEEKYNFPRDMGRCRMKHEQELRLKRIQENQPPPEPDQALVSLLEAMEGLE